LGEEKKEIVQDIIPKSELKHITTLKNIKELENYVSNFRELKA